MRKLIGRRLVTSAVTVIGCSILVFTLRFLLPGGPVQDMIGGSGQSSAGGGGQVPGAEIKALEQKFGLNHPVWVQYWNWVVAGVFHGDFGRSYYSDEPVRTVLLQRLGPSLELIVGALVVAVLAGGGLGIYSAIRRERFGGRVVLAATGLGLSFPDFWLATIAAGFLGLKLHIFPPLWPGLNPSFLASIHYVILPVLLLSIVSGAFICRQLHSSMAEALRSPYVRTAWAMGLSPRTIYMNYALRNAVGPVITLIPLSFAALVSGTVLVEYIFNIPGLGSEIVTAVINLDYPVVQATVLLLAVVVAILNLLADIALSLLDPRIRRSA